MGKIRIQNHHVQVRKLSVIEGSETTETRDISTIGTEKTVFFKVLPCGQ